jgi:hypothetical protein
MIKKLTFIISLSLLFVLSGCNTQDQKLKKVEVLSSNNTLLNTIEDEEALATFNDNLSLEDNWNEIDENYLNQQEELKKKLENHEAQYVFVTYQTAVAKNSNDTLEKVMGITVYENSNIIKVEISPDTVKNGSIPSEYLTFYFETTDKIIEYLNSLV